MSRSSGGDEPSVEFAVDGPIAGVFFGGVGAGVAFPTLSALGLIIGITPSVVGLILPTNWFTRLVVNTPAGQILDWMGIRRPMIAGPVVQGLSPFGYVLGLNPGPIPFNSVAVFLLSRACWGADSAFVFVGTFSTITHVTPDGNRGKRVDYMCGGQSLGFPAGPVVGGLITDVLGHATALAVAGYMGLLVALVAIFALPDVKTDMTAASSLREVSRLVSTDTRIFIVGTVNFAVRFLFSGVPLSTAALYATASNISLDGLSGVGASGVMTAVGVVTSNVTMLVVGRYSDRSSNRAVLTLPALGVLAVRFIPLALVPMLPLTLAGVALIGVGVGGLNSPSLAYLGDLNPADDVDKLGGVYNVFGDSRSTLGPLVAVPLVEVVDFCVEYSVCVALVVVVGLLVARTLYGEAAAVPGSELL